MITLPQHPEANQVLGEVATELGVRGVSATAYMPRRGQWLAPIPVEALGAEIVVDSPLAGAHQHRNVALAIAAAVELAEQARISRLRQRASLRGFGRRAGRGGWSALSETAWNGFWMWRTIRRERGLCARDCAARVGDEKPRTLIFSCLRDKPVAEMAQILFPLFEK